jgi:AraC-like DNA-binding protein
MSDTVIEPMISSQTVRALIDRLAEYKLPVPRLLAMADISSVRVADIHDHVPLRSYVRLIELAAGLSGEPLFGLSMSTSAGPETLGALGFLFLSSRTLGDALATLGRYINVVQDATENNVVRQGENTAVTYQIRDDSISPRRHDAEFSIGLMLRLIRSYAGERVTPTEVHLEHAPGAPTRSYERLYGCPVYFRQPTNAVVLPTRDLNVSSAVLSEKLHEILDAQLHETSQGRTTMLSFGEQVAGVLTPSSIRRKLSASRVARDLCISDSTLYRRLQTEDTSFKQLMNSRREALAKRLLANSAMSIADVAAAVGYSENASFTRAFRRWTNSSPQQYRRDRSAQALEIDG